MGVSADVYSTSLLYPFQREAWRLLDLGRCRLPLWMHRAGAVHGLCIEGLAQDRSAMLCT